MGYLIKKAATDIVKAKVTLTNADLTTSNFVVDIPEYPAIANHYWLVIYLSAEIVNGSIPYTNQSVIHIQSANAANIMFRFDANLMQGNTGTFRFAEIRTGTLNSVQFVINDSLQIHNPTALLAGDNELNIYIGATLIKY
jgi:hypothetical protein